MKTYNFEQAMEALAHGIDVIRARESDVFYGDKPFSDEKCMQINFDDFYATDWVAYEGD